MGRAERIARIDQVIIVCTGKDCKKAGGADNCKAAKATVKELDVKRSMLVVKSRCMGLCKCGPVVCFQPANHWIIKATPKEVRKAIKERCAG